MAIRSKRINSRQKGKRGERAFRDVLREAGYPGTHRGQQFCGLQGNADVVCPDLPEIHWEVKCCESGNLYNWLQQATEDRPLVESMPVVAHKRNGREWVAIMSMNSFLEIVRRSDLPKLSTSDHAMSVLHSSGAYMDSMGIPHFDNKVRIP